MLDAAASADAGPGRQENIPGDETLQKIDGFECRKMGRGIRVTPQPHAEAV